MTPKEISEAIAKKYGTSQTGKMHQRINRAIRKLPGGNETLDALEALNAARNHAQRAGALGRVTATDAAIDRVEGIRSAMQRHVLCSVGADQTNDQKQ